MAINTNGFVMLSSLFILGLISSTIITEIYFFSSLRKIEYAQHKCRLSLLQVQEQILKGLEKLKKMNKSAKHLRKRKRSAIKNLRYATSSANPTAIVIAKARIAAVTAAQIKFSLKQKSLIAYTNQKAKHTFNMSLLDLKKTALKNKLLDFTYKKKIFNKLQVKAFPKNSLSPNYIEVNHFKQKQKISAEWRWSEKWNLINLIRIISKHKKKDSIEKDNLNINIYQQCSSIPKKHSLKWISSLKEDKYLLNF